MNYHEFKSALHHIPVFSTKDVEKYFPAFDSRRLVEWQDKGYIQKIRNRFYRFRDGNAPDPDLYYIANKIYYPSYISLESALSFYGIIPEGVFQITSCTTRKTQKFNTPDGSFSYRNIKTEMFWGYRVEKLKSLQFSIATPEKAIVDYLYLHSEIRSADHFESLRWNVMEIQEKVSFETIKYYGKSLNSVALSKRIALLMEFINA